MYGYYEKDYISKTKKSVNYAQVGDESSSNKLFLSYGNTENTVKNVW